MNPKQKYNFLFLALMMLVAVAACKKDEMPNQDPLLISNVKNTAIKKLRQYSTPQEIALPDSIQINGIVISDAAAKNIEANTLVLQGNKGDTAGIIVSFDAPHNFKPGDALAINAGGQKLVQKNGELTLSQVSLSRVTKKGAGLNVTPMSPPLQTVLNNPSAYAGTLVRFYGGDFLSNKKYSGTIRYNEQYSTAGIGVKVFPGATFENRPAPDSVSIITGILRMNGTEPYIAVRDTTDVLNAAITRSVLEDWSNMKIIVSGNNAGIVTPNIYYNGGFVTPFQEYGASDGLWGYRPSYDADTSFSKGTKPFLYTFSGVSWRPATIATFGGSKMAGVKEIRVSFAGSKVEGEIASYVSWNGRKYSFSVYPFDPVKDYFQLRLGYGNVGLVSPKYDAPGTEHTVVFKLLTPAEWIKKIRYPNGMVTYYEQKWADEYFNTPNFTLYNASTRDKDLQTNGRWGNIFAPIVVTKVEYLF